MKTGFSALILLSIVLFAQVQRPSNASENYVGNGNYLSFNDEVVCGHDINSAQKCLPDKQQKQEVAGWKNAIRKAADMLPREFFKETGTIGWKFFVDRDDWTTAYAGFPIDINLLSNYTYPPEWMVWEPYGKNGLSETERMFIALHEMGHISSWGLNWLIYDYQIQVAKEGGLTLYGKARGEGEDFAESFALYVMWPEYLKENFPRHYAIINKILKKEYKTYYCIPESMKTRLTVSFETNRCEQ
jgi:hypothetical protein